MTLKTLEHSFNLLKKNPVIFLPDLFQILLTYVMVYIIYYYTGASSILPLLQSTETASLEAISTFISTNLAQIIISVISFVVITFIVGVGVMIFKYTLIKDAVTNKKLSLKTAWKENQDLFIPIVLLRILLFVACLIVFAIIALFALLIYFIILQFSAASAPYIAILIGILLTTITLLLLKFIILFRYPIMFFKKLKHPVRVLKESLNMFKHDPWFVIYTWVVTALIGLVFSLITYSLTSAVNGGLTLLQSVTLIMVLNTIWLIIDILIGLTGQIWSEIYIFVRYSKRQTS